MKRFNVLDISPLVEFLEECGSPLPLEYVGILMNFDELLDEVVSLVHKLPEDAALEENFTVTETVSFDDPLMPDEFYNADEELKHRLTELFCDLVYWEYRDFFLSFDNGEYFDRNNEIERLASELFVSADYMDSHGIVNYYQLCFNLPGIARVVDDAYDDDDIFCALDNAVAGTISHALLKDIEQMMDVAAMLRTVDPSKVSREEVSELRECVMRLCPFLYLSSHYEDAENLILDVADEISQKLQEDILKPLVILKRCLPQAVEYYLKCCEAIEHTRKLFKELASGLAAQFEDIEYWREYFEINKRYGILAQLFPEDEQYQQFRERAEEEHDVDSAMV